MRTLLDVIEFLAGQYRFDMQVLQNAWMWIPLGIPALCYVLFMVTKWSVLTIPVWVPFYRFVHVRQKQPIQSADNLSRKRAIDKAMRASNS